MDRNKTPYERDDDGLYYTHEDVAVRLFPTWTTPSAEIRAFSYPDGSPKNSLSVQELREVATMLNDAAEELEALINDSDD